MFGLRSALAVIIASAALTTSAYAQDDQLSRTAPQDFQVQRQRAQDDNLAGNDARIPPRFIVQAISFKAVNERSGSSNDVFAYFWTEDTSLATRNFDIDEGETIQFPRTQNCVLPAVDTDGRTNNRWSCDRAGRAGPLQFTLSIIDASARSRVLSAFCGALRPGDLGRCAKYYDTGSLFDVEYRYGASELLPQLDPACSCFTHTQRQQLNSEVTYEFTFRITMVDPGTSASALSPN